MIDGEGEPFVILGLASVCLLLTGLVLYMSIPDGFHLERRHFVYVGMAAIALLIYVAALAALYHSQDRQDFWKYLGLYLGPALVALGWVVTKRGQCSQFAKTAHHQFDSSILHQRETHRR